MWPVSENWDAAGALTNESRVEVWSEGELVTDDAEILSGSVTEKRVTGIRSTFSLTVEPSPEWISWLRLPRLELRPYAGMGWGIGDPELLPLGRFPVNTQAVGAPLPASVSIQASDYWGWSISGQSLDVPMTSKKGSITDSIWFLMAKWSPALRRPPRITATSKAQTARVVWDGNVQTIIADLCRSIGAEAFIDREGVPVIQNRRTFASLVMRDGEGGTIISIDPTIDWSNVFNRMAITSSNQDIVFAPVIAVVTDPDHPAHEGNIGRKVASGYSSPYFRNRAQALAAAPRLLAPYTEPALSWKVTAIPDPARMPGDRQVVVTEALGTVTAVVDEITHDLMGAPMQMTLAA